MNALKHVLHKMTGIKSIKQIDNELLLSCNDSVTAEQVNKFCFENGLLLNKLSVKHKSLETRFLEITGNQNDR
jgi:ABC-2 type transport system ATP-binding protein